MEHGTAQNDRRVAALQVGQPFNPFRLFTGIFIPEALVRYKGISAGAKLTYGRLARYAGHDGRCYPAVPTLAWEIGISVRQVQNYLSELERNKLIRRATRFSDRGQQSNVFQFLWHTLLEEGVKNAAPEGVKDPAPGGCRILHPEESQIQESQEKEADLDCPATNRKKRDSRLDPVSPPPECRKHPRLREALVDYMMCGLDDERVYPSDRHVVDVMDAGGGATEDEVIQCLVYLSDQRGLKPGTQHGPRHFSWFPTVVGDYFRRKREREQAANPVGIPDPPLSDVRFDSMTDAIESDRCPERS